LPRDNPRKKQRGSPHCSRRANTRDKGVALAARGVTREKVFPSQRCFSKGKDRSKSLFNSKKTQGAGSKHTTPERRTSACFQKREFSFPPSKGACRTKRSRRGGRVHKIGDKGTRNIHIVFAGQGGRGLQRAGEREERGHFGCRERSA